MVRGAFFMGRRPREEEEGGIYHIIQRGNNRESVFREDRDREYMTGLLYLISKTGCKIFGYVIMGNHYHLVLKTGKELLQKVMHRLNLRYSKYYNKEHDRTGHVFQGRYKAIPVREEKYILALLRYVHQNPVKAGACKRVEEYGWSSDSYYRKGKNGWVETSLVLEMLSKKQGIALKKYAQFMSIEEKENFEGVTVIGAGVPTTAAGGREKENAEKEKRKSVDEVLRATGVSEEEFNLIKAGSRRRDLTEYKLRYAREAITLNYTLKEIGVNINTSDIAVFQMLRRHI